MEKLGHAVREMMDPGAEILPTLSGMVELDEKYVGGKPRYQQGVKHKRGKGTDKQWVLVAVERNGPVRAVPVASDKIAELFPQVERFVDRDAYLIRAVFPGSEDFPIKHSEVGKLSWLRNLT